MRHIKVAHANYLEEDGVKTLGLCDDPETPGEFVIVQDQIGPYDRQDRALGMDRCCFEFSDTGAGCVFYADLQQAELGVGRLLIRFPAAEQEKEPLCRDAEIVWDQAHDAGIAAAIRNFFEGQSCFGAETEPR